MEENIKVNPQDKLSCADIAQYMMVHSLDRLRYVVLFLKILAGFLNTQDQFFITNDVIS